MSWLPTNHQISILRMQAELAYVTNRATTIVYPQIVKGVHQTSILECILHKLEPHGHHGVWNHQQVDSLFNSLFWLITKEATKLRITGPLSNGDWWLPSPTHPHPHLNPKGPVMWKTFLRHSVIMGILIINSSSKQPINGINHFSVFIIVYN